jgi:hypothetical protein
MLSLERVIARLAVWNGLAVKLQKNKGIKVCLGSEKLYSLN